MANFSVLLLFGGLIVLGVAIKKQVEIGPKPEDPLSRAGIAYKRSQDQVNPWWWAVWGIFGLGGATFYASDICNALLRS